MSAPHSIYIEAPVKKVFDFFKDPRNSQMLGTEPRFQLTQVHLTEEGLGTFWVASFKLPGARAEFFGVYTEFVPNKRIVERYSLAFEGTWTHTFDAEGSGTRVTVQRHPRSFWRLGPFDKLVDLREGPASERYLAKLKEFMEADSAPVSPAAKGSS
jgi:uncharacterized protein YndB with AHSA1/START domain